MTLREKIKSELDINVYKNDEILIAGLMKSYNESLIFDLLKEIKDAKGNLKDLAVNYDYYKIVLYERIKAICLPIWIQEKKYKIDLLLTHDDIIEECTSCTANTTYDTLLFKLNEMHEKGIPFAIMSHFFKKMKINRPITVNEIVSFFGRNEKENEIFVESLRVLYRSQQAFKREKFPNIMKKHENLNEVKKHEGSNSYY